jgi:hypothetical protein
MILRIFLKAFMPLLRFFASLEVPKVVPLSASTQVNDETAKAMNVPLVLGAALHIPLT